MDAQQDYSWSRAGAFASLLLVMLGGCATAPEPNEARRTPAGSTAAAPGAASPAAAARGLGDATAATPARAPAAAETWGGLDFKEVNEKDWLAGVRKKLAAELRVDPSELLFSPSKMRAVFLRGLVSTSKKMRGHPRPHRFLIVIVDNQGRRQGSFRPITAPHSDEPPKDVRFLSEDRLVYEVVSPPPLEPPAAKMKPRAAATKRTARPPSQHKKDRKVLHEAPVPAVEKPVTPPRLFVIQPIEPRARPIRCEGRQFAFTSDNGHLAFVGGAPDAGFVAVDGTPVYPRRGRTTIPSPVAWSKDGHSLAFLEAPPAAPARLILLAEFDNPTGDTTWNLPATGSVDGMRVFWAGSGKLVVGKSVGHPIFSASFERQRPATAGPYGGAGP